MSKEINPRNYQHEIKRFVQYEIPEIFSGNEEIKTEVKMPWVYSFFNLASEIQELNVTKDGSDDEILEAGDVMFSIADLCNIFHFSFDDIVNFIDEIQDSPIINHHKYQTWGYVYIILDMGAKFTRDLKEIDKHILFSALAGIYQETMHSVNYHCKMEKLPEFVNKCPDVRTRVVSINEILYRNICKLEGRLSRNTIKGDGDVR